MSLVGLGQGNSNIWHFGDYAGLDFSSGTAVAINSGLDGGGADKDQEKLNAEIKKYNLEDRVQLTGNMSNEDIMTLYTNTPVDLVLNLSFRENKCLE